jgi:hypothetical protein
MLGAPETALKERLGHAVVELIATRADCQAPQPPTDYKSIDVNISPIADDLPMQIDAQIKGVTTLELQGSFLKYKLPKRNYDHLRRTDVLVPRMLIVADINKAPDNWVRCEDDKVIFSNSVYWMDLHGFPAAAQKSDVPLKIPVANRLSASELVALLERGYANTKSGKGGLS